MHSLAESPDRPKQRQRRSEIEKETHKVAVQFIGSIKFLSIGNASSPTNTNGSAGSLVPLKGSFAGKSRFWDFKSLRLLN